MFYLHRLLELFSQVGGGGVSTKIVLVSHRFALIVRVDMHVYNMAWLVLLPFPPSHRMFPLDPYSVSFMPAPINNSSSSELRKTPLYTGLGPA